MRKIFPSDPVQCSQSQIVRVSFLNYSASFAVMRAYYEWAIRSVSARMCCTRSAGARWGNSKLAISTGPMTASAPSRVRSAAAPMRGQQSGNDTFRSEAVAVRWRRRRRRLYQGRSVWSGSGPAHADRLAFAAQSPPRPSVLSLKSVTIT